MAILTMEASPAACDLGTALTRALSLQYRYFVLRGAPSLDEP
jgi:hypothetical protein